MEEGKLTKWNVYPDGSDRVFIIYAKDGDSVCEFWESVAHVFECSDGAVFERVTS